MSFRVVRSSKFRHVFGQALVSLRNELSVYAETTILPYNFLETRAVL